MNRFKQNLKNLIPVTMKAVTVLCGGSFLCYFAGVLDAGCKKSGIYVILKAVQGHMVNMALFYLVYEVWVKTP